MFLKTEVPLKFSSFSQKTTDVQMLKVEKLER